MLSLRNQPPASFSSRPIALVLVAAALAGCASRPLPPPPIAQGDREAVREYITQQIRERMAKHDVTGLSIALVDDQQIVWAEGFGYADKANKVPATADTLYRVGSITKLFTATAAMQLAEQGRFDIDKPLASYLPDFSIRSRFSGTPAVTPRMLMTHHSGLPSDWQKGMWIAQPEPFTKLVSYIKDEYAAYPPNHVLSYSNVGVTLLGHAMQQAAGEDYASLVTHRLLQPLGMTHSVLSPRAEGPGMSKAYRKGSEETEAALRDVPAGGLNSSVTDLARLLEMVFADGRAGSQRILKPETLAEMLRPQNADVPLDRDLRVGLGWFLNPLEGIDPETAGPTIRHNGATVMHRSQLMALPKHKLGVIVLSNSSTAGGIVNSIAAETLKLALQAKTGIATQPRKRSSPNSIRLLSDEDLKSFTGYYATPFGFAKVEGNSDNLRANLFGKTFGLVLRQDGYLGLQYRLLGLLPLPVDALSDVALSRENIAGHEVLLAHNHGRATLAGEKITPAPLPDAWLARLGEYEAENAEGGAFAPRKISLLHRDGFLLVEATVSDISNDPIRMAVAPVSNSELVVLGLGRQMGETIRVVSTAEGERVLYSGYVLKKKTQEDKP